MRKPVPVRSGTKADCTVVTDIFARAFIDDPALVWRFDGHGDRPRRLERLYALITRVDADPADWSLALDDKGVPVAVALTRLVAGFGTRLPRALSLQGQMEAHHPTAPHWYL